MKKLFLSAIETLLRPLYGKKQFQKFFGYLYFCSLRGLNYKNDSIEKNGEAFVAKRIIDYYQKKNDNIIIFDVGGNVGQYSSMITKLLSDCDYKLYVFEPLKRTFDKLRVNLNPLLSDKIKLKNIGLGRENISTQIFSSTDSSAIASLYKHDFSHLNLQMEAEADLVEIQTLKDFCTYEGVSNINFLKIDVEGSEYDVLCGAEDFIKTFAIDFIQFEFGGTSMSNRIYFKDLFELLHKNYKIYRILKNGLSEYVNYSTDYEILELSNYLAVSRLIEEPFR